MQHYLEAISNDTEIIWSTTTVKTKNSTNLESGRRPKFKSVEFFVFTLTVNELLKCEKAAFHFHAALFGARSHLRIKSVPLSHDGGLMRSVSAPDEPFLWVVEPWV